MDRLPLGAVRTQVQESNSQGRVAVVFIHTVTTWRQPLRGCATHPLFEMTA